jgi:hypothetical protein
VTEASTLGGKEQKTDKEKTDENLTVQQLINEKSAHPSTPTKGCPHFLGYLSKRSSKEKMPEECIMCANVVNCMLKDVTG